MSDTPTPGQGLTPAMLRVDSALGPLLALATEAIPFLQTAFGATLLDIQARIRHDEAGAPLVRVVAVCASHDLPFLEGLLRAFDETWWLANCHRSGGQLVFDYETRLLEDHPHA